ncbi:MAG: RdgB/HAM1 family non-canonical purine NTP pyrophosphatase [Cytophagales bacterium]|nr:RdgB/HAM1 family non-canonical purine NTP pyrophosphatase [Cytophagales bacterium]
MRLCFATNNSHKVDEVRSLLGSAVGLITLREAGITVELPEEQDTLEGNAAQKASFVFDRYGIPCFADDSGLEVDALEGAPGVISAHYAGPQRNSDHNIDLLLKNLEGSNSRSAQFRTVVALALPKGQWYFEGIVRGVILEERRGNTGFGYDPVFLPENVQKTLAEMTMEEKNQISHRAMAVQKLVEFLRTQ